MDTTKKITHIDSPSRENLLSPPIPPSPRLPLPPQPDPLIAPIRPPRPTLKISSYYHHLHLQEHVEVKK
ncbi:unnamed protein product [Cunninghamella blakesleeana]